MRFCLLVCLALVGRLSLGIKAFVCKWFGSDLTGTLYGIPQGRSVGATAVTLLLALISVLPYAGTPLIALEKLVSPQV